MSCMFMMNDPWYSHTHPLSSLPHLSSFPPSPSMCLLPHSFCFVLWAAEFSPGHLCDMDFKISAGDSGCPSPSTNIQNFSLQRFDPRVSPSLIHGRLVMGPVLSRPSAIAAHRVYKLEMAFASPSPHSLALKSFLPPLLQCPLGLKGDGRNVLVRAKSSIVKMSSTPGAIPQGSSQTEGSRFSFYFTVSRLEKEVAHSIPPN